MAEIELTSSDNEKAVSARLGDVVTVRLKEQPTTGYRWITGTIGEQLEREESSYLPEQGHGVGSGGERVIKFTAKHPGSAIIEMKRMRVWEKDSPSAERFHVVVNIR